MATEAPFDARAWEEVDAYLNGLGDGAARLATRIHPADEMYRYEMLAPHRTPRAASILYFAAGGQILHAVEQIARWRFGALAGVRSLLDFASGYGRTTRHLARFLDPARITVAEIEPDAVRFQTETFGVRGIVSATRPEDLRIEGQFDVVLAASFFSHLPALRFEQWLGRLYAATAPGGVLIFSVHGMDLLPGLEIDRVSGIVFQPVSETTRLDGAEYGTSYVTPEFVRAVAERVAGGEARFVGSPFGLCGFQDLYVLVRPPSPSLPELHVERFPWGTLDASAIRDGVASVAGWAIGAPDERPPDARLFLGDRVAAISPGEGPRGARHRWSFAFPVASVSPDTMVRVEVQSERGLTRILVAATLRPYLPAPPV